MISGSNERYFDRWRRDGQGPLARVARARALRRFAGRVEAHGYSLTDL